MDINLPVSMHCWGHGKHPDRISSTAANKNICISNLRLIIARLLLESETYMPFDGPAIAFQGMSVYGLNMDEYWWLGGVRLAACFLDS